MCCRITYEAVSHKFKEFAYLRLGQTSAHGSLRKEVQIFSVVTSACSDHFLSLKQELVTVFTLSATFVEIGKVEL